MLGISKRISFEKLVYFFSFNFAIRLYQGKKFSSINLLHCPISPLV